MFGTPVARHETDDLFVSTIFARDTKRYETAIAHAEFKDNALIIVEQYDTEEDAQTGHHKWLDVMKNNPTELPDSQCGGSHKRSSILPSPTTMEPAKPPWEKGDDNVQSLN